jgi:hypothetical protein
MEPFNWIANNWFDLFQTGAVLLTLFATLHTIRQDTRSRKVGNAIALTNSHREMWSLLLHDPRLKRVLDAKADLSRCPPTLEEELFVQMLLLHLRMALKAREAKQEFGDENIAADVHEVFGLPIPRAVWNRTKHLQDSALKALID